MADDEKRTEPKTAAELAAEWAQAKNEAAAHKDAAKAFGQRADAIEEAMLGAFEYEGVVKVTVNADAISAHLDANNEVFLQREPSSYTVSPYLLPVAKFPAGKDSAIALLQGSPEWGWLVKHEHDGKHSAGARRRRRRRYPRRLEGSDRGRRDHAHQSHTGKVGLQTTQPQRSTPDEQQRKRKQVGKGSDVRYPGAD